MEKANLGRKLDWPSATNYVWRQVIFEVA